MRIVVSFFCILLLVFQNAGAQINNMYKTFGLESVYVDSSSIISWASRITIERGYLNISDKNLGFAESGDNENGLGKADSYTVSLGDSGVAVVGFDIPIKNIPGGDFAVFENSFDGSFLELAFVEVSSDSIRWVRFPSVSLTPTDIQIDSYGLINPLDINNLAGKFKVLYGTPFDLEVLTDSAEIDLNNIRYVRIIDVVGSISEDLGTKDSNGNIINDPWPTPFTSSGFDLDAVAVLGLPTLSKNLKSPIRKLYPIPATEIIKIEFIRNKNYLLKVIGSMGQELESINIQGLRYSLDIRDLQPGLYFIKIVDGGVIYSEPFIKI